MIPKVIHYAWFGNNQMPEKVLACIESWHKYCPDYDIKLWTEDNYDVNQCQYMKEAYENKKWSFVSDYFRLDIIYKYGGIYLDTDVELIRNLDDFLDTHLYMGVEKTSKGCFVNLGLGFGAEAGHSLVKEMRDDYLSRKFVLPNGDLNMEACPDIQTRILEKYGFNKKDKKYYLEDFIIFPSDYFSPLNYETGIMCVTENTYSIHHYHASWKSERRREIIALRWELNKKYKSQFFIKVLSLIIVYKRYYGAGAILELLKHAGKKIIRLCKK